MRDDESVRFISGPGRPIFRRYTDDDRCIRDYLQIKYSSKIYYLDNDALYFIYRLTNMYFICLPSYVQYSKNWFSYSKRPLDILTVVSMLRTYILHCFEFKFTYFLKIIFLRIIVIYYIFVIFLCYLDNWKLSFICIK